MLDFSSFFEWLQATRLATTVGGSPALTGLLSGIHLLGLTIVLGGAFVSGLRLLGVLLPDQPVTEVAAPAARAMVVGMAASVATGSLMFASRASEIAAIEIFQVKMALLFTAVIFHFTVYLKTTRQDDAPVRRLRLSGILGLALWFGVALAGSGFILLE